jgi:hypothetical protein
VASGMGANDDCSTRGGSFLSPLEGGPGDITCVGNSGSTRSSTYSSVGIRCCSNP